MNYTTTSQEILNKAFDKESKALKTIVGKKTNGSDIQKDFYLKQQGLSLQEIFNAVYDRESGCLTINNSGSIDPDEDYYTKTEVNDKLSLKVDNETLDDYLTESETRTELNGLYNDVMSNVNGLQNYVDETKATKLELNNYFQNNYSEILIFESGSYISDSPTSFEINALNDFQLFSSNSKVSLNSYKYFEIDTSTSPDGFQLMHRGKTIGINTDKILLQGYGVSLTLEPGQLKLNGNNLNAVGGLVTVGEDGKINSSLINISLDDYYTKTEVDSKFVEFSQNMFWKESVSTFDEIAVKYPNPQEGWTVSTNDTNIIYRYDDETKQWIDIGKSVSIAGYDTQGIASFDQEYFVVVSGHVSINTDKVASKDYVDEKIEETQPVLNLNQIRFINWGASLSETELNNLQDYVNNYDYFVNYLKNNFEVKEEIITMLPVAQGGSVTPVYITIQGEEQNVDDDGDLDGDVETQYRFDIAGYVIDVESYGSDTSSQTDRFYPKIVYDKDCKDVIDENIDKTFGITHIYFSQEEYDQISSLDSDNNKNIVKIHYVQFKK